MSVISLRLKDREIKRINELSKMGHKDKSAVARELIDYGWEFLMLKLYREGKMSLSALSEKLELSVSETIDLLSEFGVESRYRKSQLEYERYAVLAVSSIYGIDILKDNVVECRKRLFGIFDQKYTSLFKKRAKEECRNAVKYILKRNIIWGDALTLKTVGDNQQPIVFPEWSPARGSFFKRRDFAFHELLPEKKERAMPLFSKIDKPLYSDLGGEVFIPNGSLYLRIKSTYAADIKNHSVLAPSGGKSY
ncbi:MAG: hypothetical protein HY756_06215 [Nitrospirae bacterium]|nr:hypothetical protein [Nitrospirota bacterium]